MLSANMSEQKYCHEKTTRGKMSCFRQTFSTISTEVFHSPETVSSFNLKLEESDAVTQLFTRELTEHYLAAKYEQALVVSKKMRKHCFYAYGGQSPVFASTLNNQALIYKMLGDYHVAHNIFELALSVYEAGVGPRHIHCAVALQNLATVQVQLLRLDEAEVNCERALTLRQDIQGKEHVDVSTCQLLLASIYRARGDLQRTLDLQNIAMLYLKRILGAEHLRTATAMNNIGLTHKQIAVQHRELSLRSAISKSDYAELTNNTAAEKHFLHAEEFLIASCGVRFRALGSRHPEYVSSLHNLAELYHAFGYKEKCDHVRDNISSFFGDTDGSQKTDSASETPL